MNQDQYKGWSEEDRNDKKESMLKIGIGICLKKEKKK